MVDINTKQYRLDVRHRSKKARTRKRWEMSLNESLKVKEKGCQELVGETRCCAPLLTAANIFGIDEGAVTRYSYGKVILKKFHRLELSARPRPQHPQRYKDELLNSATSWHMIPAGHSFIAIDATGVRMVASFPSGMEDTLGKARPSVVDTIAKNIKSIVDICPPKPSSNSRHPAAQQWEAENAHISQFGTIEWAVRREQGHAGAGPTISRDTAVGGGVRKFPLVRRLLTTLGNVTRLIHALFGAVDNDFQNAYASAFEKIPVDY